MVCRTVEQGDDLLHLRHLPYGFGNNINCTDFKQTFSSLVEQGNVLLFIGRDDSITGLGKNGTKFAPLFTDFSEKIRIFDGGRYRSSNGFQQGHMFLVEVPWKRMI